MNGLRFDQNLVFFSFSEFDDDSYKSEEDPDFVPPANALEIDDVSASDSSSDGDSTDTEVMQE